ncbi:MAG: hypothetical protein NTW07_12800, partial [candidate division Zixibacteria bacterium]|nr:hypothetical protein [candidate division Zixibacteria bacterium]
MALLERINQFIFLIVESLRQFAQWRIWAVLLPYYFLQWLVLYVLYIYPEGFLGGLVFRWASLFGTDQAAAFGHYPQHLLLIGGISTWAKLLVGLIFESLVLGSVAIKFQIRFTQGRELSASLRSFPMKWLNLTLVWLVINGIMLVAGQFLPGLIGPALDNPRRVLAFNYVVMPLVFTFIFSLTFLAIPSVVLFQDGALRAMGRSLKHFLQRPFTMFGLGIVILAVPILLGALAS